MSEVKITYIGGPTALIEVAGLRLLTDPTFDAPGRKYNFGWGTSSVKLGGPALSAAQLGPIDAVLLSHDQHDDNLDDAGRAMLPESKRVITTPAGEKRLGGNAAGLAPWGSTVLSAADGTEVRITATPCRHGPPLSRPIVGEVIGFLLEWEGQREGALWITGDTVWFGGLAEVAERFDVGTAIVNLGGVRFPITGPARYTMNAAEAVRVCREFNLTNLVPLHFEGWKHFRQGPDEVKSAFAAAGIEGQVRWLTPAEPVAIEV
ncbi:MAG TPA: MBL fold metallo-hydrolase [Solirubrobacterales bacterium]